MQSLFDFADDLGVTVEYAPLESRDGEYRDDLSRIRLREGMTDRLARWTLAHELGHAVHHDTLTIFGRSEPRQERRADEWAARFLIDLDDYREAERLREGHIPSMAHDLGVITRGIDAYQRQLTRIGDTVYLQPSLGRCTSRKTA